MNTGLILAVQGIPYFNLDMRAVASGQLAIANPGEGKCCLIVECDAIQKEMNISRSGLVDSESTHHFFRVVSEAIREVEERSTHRAFRQVPAKRKERRGVIELGKRKQELERPEQAWVFWQPREDVDPVQLHRLPENETDTLAILWKLEALRALPFKTFTTLAYSGQGADLVAHFQEDENTEPERYATMEIEHRFYNFKAHGHPIAAYPTVLCWEVAQKPKLSVRPAVKPYKFVVQLEEAILRIYALSRMPGLVVLSNEDMRRRAAAKVWTGAR